MPAKEEVELTILLGEGSPQATASSTQPKRPRIRQILKQVPLVRVVTTEMEREKWLLARQKAYMRAQREEHGPQGNQHTQQAEHNLQEMPQVDPWNMNVPLSLPTIPQETIEALIVDLEPLKYLNEYRRLLGINGPSRNLISSGLYNYDRDTFYRAVDQLPTGSNSSSVYAGAVRQMKQQLTSLVAEQSIPDPSISNYNTMSDSLGAIQRDSKPLNGFPDEHTPFYGNIGSPVLIPHQVHNGDNSTDDDNATNNSNATDNGNTTDNSNATDNNNITDNSTGSNDSTDNNDNATDNGNITGNDNVTGNDSNDSVFDRILDMPSPARRQFMQWILLDFC
ncbi:hypothetical protein GGR58DRAFT_523456 [Xylaria digitata]|nr:hypothetical protein GGR58DRAFT_523456 [Xylaria digitata]